MRRQCELLFLPTIKMILIITLREVKALRNELYTSLVVNLLYSNIKEKYCSQYIIKKVVTLARSSSKFINYIKFTDNTFSLSNWQNTMARRIFNDQQQ